MTPTDWKKYEEAEDDIYDNDMFEYSHYYFQNESNVQKAIKWSAFLAHQEKSQEEFREKQMYLCPPQGRTLGQLM